MNPSAQGIAEHLCTKAFTFVSEDVQPLLTTREPNASHLSTATLPTLVAEQQVLWPGASINLQLASKMEATITNNKHE